MDRKAVEAELRAQLPGTYDYQLLATQEALIATRMRDLTSRQPVAAVDAPVIIRHRKPTATLPPFPGPDANEGELREALRRAIEDAEIASYDVQAASNLANRAADRIMECQAELDQFDGLDDQIAEYEMRALRRGEEDEPLPYDLESALRERSIARDRLERATATQQRVEIELEQADLKLAPAQQRLQHAVSSLAIHEARHLMVELDELEEQAHAIRVRIASLQIPSNLPDDLAQRPFKPLSPVKRDPELTRSWSEFMVRLRKDPQAEMNGDNGDAPKPR